MWPFIVGSSSGFVESVGSSCLNQAVYQQITGRNRSAGFAKAAILSRQWKIIDIILLTPAGAVRVFGAVVAHCAAVVSDGFSTKLPGIGTWFCLSGNRAD